MKEALHTAVKGTLYVNIKGTLRENIRRPSVGRRTDIEEQRERDLRRSQNVKGTLGQGKKRLQGLPLKLPYVQTIKGTFDQGEK